MNRQAVGLTWWQRLVLRLAELAQVRAIEPGQPGDGLVAIDSAGTELDRSWEELRQDYGDALEAWRKNPLARRIVNLVSSYVVGEGIGLSSRYRPLQRFLTAFLEHPKNRLLLRQVVLCDELTRSGELFLSLHLNPADGMSYLRPIAARVIDRIEWREGDYETELRYHELVPLDDPDYAQGGRWWLSPEAPAADQPLGDGRRYHPVMLHFAINRPVGCVRGESDLAPLLVWLKRYSAWLEDRVRLNAAVRAFLWIVEAPAGSIKGLRERYRRPPPSGSVLIVEAGKEKWQAVAPSLEAKDAQADGAAIRKMVAAGGPGIGLLDFGESDTSNLATARAMADQRSKWMQMRQAYFAYVLAQTVLTAYNRAVRLGYVRGKEQTLAAIQVKLPDINASDNEQLALAAAQMGEALGRLQELGFQGPRFRRLMLELVLRFAGVVLDGAEIEALLKDGGDDEEKPERDDENRQSG